MEFYFFWQTQLQELKSDFEKRDSTPGNIHREINELQKGVVRLTKLVADETLRLQKENQSLNKILKINVTKMLELIETPLFKNSKTVDGLKDAIKKNPTIASYTSGNIKNNIRGNAIKKLEVC